MTSKFGPPPVLVAHEWKNNAELISDVAEIGYLREEWRTWDATYRLGIVENAEWLKLAEEYLLRTS